MINGVFILPYYLIGRIILAVLIIIHHTYKDNKLLILVIGGVYVALLTFVFRYLWHVSLKSSRCEKLKRRKPDDSIKLDEVYRQDTENMENKLMLDKTINEKLEIINEQQNQIKKNNVVQHNKKRKKISKISTEDGLGNFDFDKFCKANELI